MTDDIEWGEWLNYYDWLKNADADYQFQMIDGVAQWRVRKAPPAPVVETIIIHAGFWKTNGGTWHIGSWDRQEDNRAVATFNVVDGEPDLSTLTIKVAE